MNTATRLPTYPINIVPKNITEIIVTKNADILIRKPITANKAVNPIIANKKFPNITSTKT